MGAKGLTMQTRSKGICATKGLGYIKGYGVHLDKVFDEHGIINQKDFRGKVQIGDKVEIIPNHICPVCNLYDYAYLFSGDEVLEKLEILAGGKLV